MKAKTIMTDRDAVPPLTPGCKHHPHRIKQNWEKVLTPSSLKAELEKKSDLLKCQNELADRLRRFRTFGASALLLLVLTASGCKFQKPDNPEAADLESIKIDLGNLEDAFKASRTADSANNESLVRDIQSLRTDYAEVEKFRDALKSYTAARKDLGAFRELDDACGKLFMGLLTKEQELDERLKKVEKRHR